jgi:pyridoxal 5'-phosphate synthase pdxT subunit
MLRIGILALQGAFIEHETLLKRLHVETFQIRQLKDLDSPFDGLILPGGESTVMGRLLQDLNLFAPLLKLIQNGLPVYGTCAGAILLAKRLTNDPHNWFQTMDITITRNAYGRQLGSFRAEAEFKGYGATDMVFIRAPKIDAIGKNVEVLSTWDGSVTACVEKNMLVTAFHPEVTADLTVHRYFVALCEAFKKTS